MLGLLQKNSITINKQHIFIAYGNQYYIFNTNTQKCIKNIDLGHHNDIVCSHFQEANKGKGYRVVSVDCTGGVVLGGIGGQGKGVNQQFGISNISKYSLSAKNQKLIIKQAVFTSSNTILYLTKLGQLRIAHILNPDTQPQSNPLFPHQNFSHLSFSSNSPNLTFLIHEDAKKVSILNNETQKIIKDYTHSCKISSVTNIDNILVIGDERGKIYLLHNYLQGKGKCYETVLEWHTGPVLALCSYGRHLYSAGEESVVVLWHTRDLSRDFLPRVGTAIKHLFVKSQTNEIVCLLSDNSIKIIDLSKDKQTTTYKTILDPKGYAAFDGPRFNITTTAYHNGTLCLNSVPGKIQFINVHKNIENSEIQIVPRNLINGINKDKIQPHRIQSFCFSPDWAYACFCVNSSTRSYLKFYRKGALGYQLINRLENPHQKKTKACLTVSNKIISQFVTYSEEDKILRAWSQHSQKKKSILDASQTFWRCCQEISFRDLKPTFVNAKGSYLMVIYQNSQMVIYELDNKGIFVIFDHISVNQNIKEAKIIQVELNKDKTLIKVIVSNEKGQFLLWNCAKIKNSKLKITVNQKLVPKQQLHSYFTNVGPKQTAMVLNTEKQSQILIIDNKTTKFTEAYDSDVTIQSSFWMNQKLIIICSNLSLEALDGKQFVKFESFEPQESLMQEEESTEVKIYGETDIFKLNQKWVERETLKKKSQVSDCTEGLFQLPSCISMWQQMSEKLLI